LATLIESHFLQMSALALVTCLMFSTLLYLLIVVPPGGFHFNINGIMVCEPYFISNNILALAACLFYFPTTMILMYCYGTIFHSTKVKVRYKRAVLTSLPFVGVSEDHIDHMAKQVSTQLHSFFYKSNNTLFFLQKIMANKKICDDTSKSCAAISLVFIIFNTPWAVQQVITSCTRTIVSQFLHLFVSYKSPFKKWVLDWVTLRKRGLILRWHNVRRCSVEKKEQNSIF